MNVEIETQRPRRAAAPARERGAEEILRDAERYLAPAYARPAQLFVRGSGCTLEDAEGRRYLDMTSGIGVTALGHASELVTRAIQEAAGGLVHVSNLYHTAPAVELARELVRLSFADRVFFANSGAEAVEGAVKLARLFAGEGRHTILTFEGSFHGRTMGALAATDRPDYQKPFAPLTPGFEQAGWNDPAAVERIGPHTAAVLLEPIQGEKGIRVADAQWLRALRRRCDEVGALLVFDEVQCGLGRTGRLWAHEHSEVFPDLMTLAKPLAGGLPMGAVLMTERVAAAVTPGCHGTTFGGGPLVASVALQVLRAISRPELLARVREHGELLRREIGALRSPLIAGIRGLGLFVGVQVTLPPKQVVQAAHAEGLLVVPAADQVVRFLPPLNVGRAELEQAVAALGRALRALEERGQA